MLTTQTHLSRLIIFLCIVLFCLPVLGQTTKKTTTTKTTTTTSTTTTMSSSPGSGAIINMQVYTSNDSDVSLGGSGFMSKLLSPLWTYQKISSTSTLRITYQDSVTHSGTAEGTCQWQIRVDDQQSVPPSCDPANPGLSCMYYTTPLIVASNVFNLTLSSSGLFRGLPAGAHEISIYQESVGATQCIRNSGGFTTTVTVEEIELPSTQ